MVQPLTFDFATADPAEDGIVIVLFNGPEREVVAIAKGSRDAAQVLQRALGSVLKNEAD